MKAQTTHERYIAKKMRGMTMKRAIKWLDLFVNRPYWEGYDIDKAYQALAAIEWLKKEKKP